MRAAYVIEVRVAVERTPEQEFPSAGEVGATVAVLLGTARWGVPAEISSGELWFPEVSLLDARDEGPITI